MFRVFKIFLIWLAVFWAALTVYSTCKGRIYAEDGVEKSLRWLPKYSVGLLNYNDSVLGEGLSTAQGTEIRARSIQALNKAPLSDRPFVQLATANIILNSENVDRNLLLETKKRNIRNRRALLALVNLDANAEKYDEAIKHLDILLELNATDERQDIYHNALTTLSNYPVARDAIDNYLAQNASWGERFLTTQINSMTDANFMDVETSLKLYLTSGEQDKLNASYLLALTKLGKFENGFRYWTDLEGTENKSEEYTVYNPTFEKRPALVPFNWQEINRRQYFSEIDQSGGLYASYGDSVVRTLTQQILRLKPGKLFTLNVNAEWTYRRRQGLFYWEISCLPGREVIAEFYFDETNQKSSGGAQSFQVPQEGCLHQSLKLKAKSGQYSQRIWSRTNSLNIIER